MLFNNCLKYCCDYFKRIDGGGEEGVGGFGVRVLLNQKSENLKSKKIINHISNKS